MKILVTFALENEFAPWRAMREISRRASGAKLNVYRAANWRGRSWRYFDWGRTEAGAL